MSCWDRYASRLGYKGDDTRDGVFRREVEFLRTRLPRSLSYHHAIIDGEERRLAIINSDNLNQKTLCSLPGETFRCGAFVEWMDERWLITELDANDELYTKGKMLQCNYLLRWINEENEVIERWSIVEDGTKYLTGEYGDNKFIITRGDSRISLTLPKDAETLKLGRDNRFIIDDYDSQVPLAYRLTKPFKLGGSYGKDGVLYFVLQECNTEDTDNFEKHIANYYDHFPMPDDYDAPTEEDIVVDPDKGRGGWLK